jgi:hypothetical protein
MSDLMFEDTVRYTPLGGVLQGVETGNRQAVGFFHGRTLDGAAGLVEDWRLRAVLAEQTCADLVKQIEVLESENAALKILCRFPAGG